MNKSIQNLIEELITRSRELDLLVIEESRLRILQKKPQRNYKRCLKNMMTAIHLSRITSEVMAESSNN